MKVAPPVPPRTNLPAALAACRDSTSHPATTTPAPGPAPAGSFDDARLAEQVWQQLAAKLTGTGRMRLGELGNDGKYKYPQHRERRIANRRPDLPAALTLYHRGAVTSCLAFDLDAKHHGAGAVTDDARELTALLHRFGAHVIEDVAVSGGRHLWVPLDGTVTHHRVMALMDLLHAWGRHTLDKSAPANAGAGCLTAPGTVCKNGRYRTPVTPLAAAITAVTTRSRTTIVDALITHLRDVLCVTVDERGPADPHDTNLAPSRDLRHLPRLSAEQERTAVLGVIPDRTRPDGAPWSNSEAWFSVVNAARNRGYTSTDLVDACESGPWKGLRRMLVTRFGEHRWQDAIHREYRYAARKDRPQQRVSTRPAPEKHPTGGRTHRDENSIPNNHTEAERAFIHRWLRVAEHVITEHHAGETSHTAFAVVHAVAALASRTGSRFVRAGTRSYSRAAAGVVKHTTVADALRLLCDSPEAYRIMHCRDLTNGRDANLLELIIPEQYATVGTGHTPATSVLRPVPTVFGMPDPDRPGRRLLGAAAFRLHQALTGGIKGTAAEIAAAVAVPRSTTYKWLPILATLGLAEHDTDGTWHVGPVHPADAGDPLIKQAHLHHLDEEHRLDRAAWRRTLQEFITNRIAPQPTPASPGPLPWPDDLSEPVDGSAADDADPAATALALLSEQFGATIITPEAGSAPAERPATWIGGGVRARYEPDWRSARRRTTRPDGTPEDHPTKIRMPGCYRTLRMSGQHSTNQTEENSGRKPAKPV